VPNPPATHIVPFQPILLTDVVNTLFAFVEALQVIPSVEYKISFVPTDNQILPLFFASYPLLKNVLPLVDALQVIPSVEYAKVFVPLPAATHKSFKVYGVLLGVNVGVIDGVGVFVVIGVFVLVNVGVIDGVGVFVGVVLEVIVGLGVIVAVTAGVGVGVFGINSMTISFNDLSSPK
jgi:hypothetical protein